MPINTVRAGAFASSRADLHPLVPVIDGLSRDARVVLTVLHALRLTDASLAESLGEYGISLPISTRRLGPPDAAADAASLVTAGAQIAADMADGLHDVDVLVVLGDRWELLSVVPAAVLLGIRVVHLHGGEVTRGALDDRFRDAVTHLADQHCVATSEAEARLRALGEPPERIHLTGAPGLDRLDRVTPLSPGEFKRLLGIELRRPLVMATYHPVTASWPRGAESPGAGARAALLPAMSLSGTLVVTTPGLDLGHDEVMRALADLAASHVTVVGSLGANYLRLMATADAMIGNSSSGIIESSSFRLPVVDVGVRQGGRVRARNVISAEAEPRHVAAALTRALDPTFRATLGGLANPYGDGTATPRIIDVVVGAQASPTAKVRSWDEDGRGGTEGLRP